MTPKTTANNQRRRSLDELNLMDNFLFWKMISEKETGEEFCRILLRTILGKPIRRVKIIPQQNLPGIDTDRHGIQIDAYIETIPDDPPLSGVPAVDADLVPAIYDIEPNLRYEKKLLPRRMRYYHDLIDTHLFKSGMSYERLPEVVIIIILPYDPFDRKRMVYTIQNRCLEDPSIPYEDGAKKIFLYTRGTEGNPGSALRDLLKYMEETSDQNVTNQDLESISRMVRKVKQNREVNISYMKSWEWEQMIREDARREGLEEGLQQGYTQGMESGMKQGIEDGMKQGIKEGIEKGREQGIKAFIQACREFHSSRENTFSAIARNFHLSDDDTEKYLRLFWDPHCS